MTGMLSMLKRNMKMLAQGTQTLALLGLMMLVPGAARAQSIVATVNGDPITSTDVAERAKLLSALGQSSQSALDSLIKSRLEAGEINKFGIRLSSSELAPAITYYAEKAHVTSDVLSARLAHSGVDKKHLENFLTIHQAFNMYARARNRAVEVSESDVQAELARDPKLAHQQTFILRQVLVTTPASAGNAGLEQAAKEMQTLHTRFTDCESGMKLTSEFPNMVVRDPVTRNTSQLGDQFAAVLEKLPLGHLTPPSRDSSGILAIALCSRTPARDDAVKDAARERVMARKINDSAEKLYQELRANAVIVKSKS
jgi:peptidyl-prolyl cis-trans isomerase SurA